MHIKYELSDKRTRYWNTDWILMVETLNNESDDDFQVEITSAISPGPHIKGWGMIVANGKSFIMFKLQGEEARQFVRAYEKSLEKKSGSIGTKRSPSP